MKNELGESALELKRLEAKLRIASVALRKISLGPHFEPWAIQIAVKALRDIHEQLVNDLDEQLVNDGEFENDT